MACKEMYAILVGYRLHLSKLTAIVLIYTTREIAHEGTYAGVVGWIPFERRHIRYQEIIK